jgi:dTDP-4-dehydrorhamnose 3,5-epimerase
MIDGVQFTPLKRIQDSRGEIRHAIRRSDETFVDFGEAYFSGVNHGVVKGWKQHQRMHSNLIVVTGCVRFVLFDNRSGSPTHGKIEEYVVSMKNYGRLNVPCGIWLAFQGVSNELNLLINVASIEHDPAESLTLPLDTELIPRFDWTINGDCVG